MSNDRFLTFIFFVVAIVFLAWVLDSAQQNRQACKAKTCSNPLQTPQLDRYGQCVCVELAR